MTADIMRFTLSRPGEPLRKVTLVSAQYDMIFPTRRELVAQIIIDDFDAATWLNAAYYPQDELVLRVFRNEALIDVVKGTIAQVSKALGGSGLFTATFTFIGVAQ